jgi:L-ascorbate metabolism protein UlaG (beta-lactamase superfamily)
MQMALKITYLGHSGFVLDDGAHAVAIDPFLTGNPVAKHRPADIRVKTIALTHGHADHLGDSVEIAKANGATVVGGFELTCLFDEQGIATEPMNPGGRIALEFGWIALTQAFHSNSYEGRYMGMPCGVVVHIAGVTLYHCGDTCLFGDMKLIGEIYQPDIAFIPIGDRFTMGPELGARAAELIQPKLAVPIHYKTWPVLAQSIEKFTPQGVEVKEMTPGQSWAYA